LWQTGDFRRESLAFATCRSIVIRMRRIDYDIGIVGAGFAGLACARAAARRGLRVLVIDRKPQPGARMHTTGLVVKEAAERWEIPAVLTRRVPGIRLYSPNLRTLDLDARGYYFLATDTPALMRWLAREAARAGAHLRFGRPYHGAEVVDGAVHLASGERVRWLVGADGAHSAVARDFALGRNAQFLLGAEAEFENVRGVDAERLHCFLDGRLARGYIGWVVPGHGGLFQVGLACRRPQRPRLGRFIAALSPVFDFTGARRIGYRGGLIPVGGPVSPMAAGPAMLAGDAAGLVSPLSAGGIHTALESGWIAAHAIADHDLLGAAHPSRVLALRNPRFAWKHALRAAYDVGVPDRVLDSILGTRVFTAAARSVYFHHRGLRSAEGWRDLAQTLLRGHS
jgi:flavin-dependent dehydrogenase